MPVNCVVKLVGRIMKNHIQVDTKDTGWRNHTNTQIVAVKDWGERSKKIQQKKTTITQWTE